MNGDWIFLDSNILLYLLAGDSDLLKFFSDFSPKISFIVELEILSAPDLDDKTLFQIKRLLSNLGIMRYPDEMKDIIINIRKQKKLKLPDSIIAATAIYYKSPLITADKAFKNISGLELIYYEPKVN
ncbi:type II toxin-antitoxin system VapC family toxin [Mucilaginibacter sp. AW1-3]